MPRPFFREPRSYDEEKEDAEGPSWGQQLAQKRRGFAAPAPPGGATGHKRSAADAGLARRNVAKRRFVAAEPDGDSEVDADGDAEPLDEDESDGSDESGGGENDDDAHASGERRRRNKHAPAEMPSNKPVGRFRQVMEVPKLIRRGEFLAQR
jgi:hypothetical protein